MPPSRDARKNIDIQTTTENHTAEESQLSALCETDSRHQQFMRQATLDLLLAVELTHSQLSRLAEL